MNQNNSNLKMMTLANPDKRLSATLLPGDLQRLIELCETSGVSVSCIARQAIRKYLVDSGKENVPDVRERKSEV